MLHRRQLVMGALALSIGAANAGFQDPLKRGAVMVQIPESRSLFSVAAAGQRFVAVGMRGVIVVSDDAGATWRQIPLALSTDLVSVTFASERVGWACGHGGVILVTDDGGLTWSVQLKGMDFSDILIKHHEQAAGEGQAGAAEMVEFIKASFAAGPEQPVLGVWFDDEKTGWAVSTFGMILGTKDGGTTWTSWMDKMDNPDLLHFYSVGAVGGDIYITSERGKIFKFNRTAQRFVELNTGYRGGLFGLTGSKDALIAFGLQGTVFRSADLGATWQRIETGLRVGLNAGTMLPDGRTAIVTQDGRILMISTQGQVLQSERLTRPGLLTGVLPIGSSQLMVVGFNGIQLVNV